MNEIENEKIKIKNNITKIIIAIILFIIFILGIIISFMLSKVVI